MCVKKKKKKTKSKYLEIPRKQLILLWFCINIWGVLKSLLSACVDVYVAIMFQ